MVNIPIEISARHIHLSKKDLEALFGRGYQLKKKKDLVQCCDFAAEETVDIEKNGKKISKVRIVGPAREETQLELSLTDAYFLGEGAKIPVKQSGDLKNTPGIILIGPKRKLAIRRGVIVSWRHIHLSLKEAKRLNIDKKKFVSVKIKGKRGLILNNVWIRIGEKYHLSMHLDTDEGNAAGIPVKGKGKIIIWF